MAKLFAGFVIGMCVAAVAGYLLWARALTPPDDVIDERTAAAAESARPASVAPAAGDRGERPAGASEPRERMVSRPRIESGGRSDASPMRHEADLELPGGKLAQQRSGDVAPLDKLLSSMSVYCRFDPGAGGQWPKGSLFPHTAAWQGGPIEFSSMDFVEQRAQMLGSEGATGSREGVLPIRLTATDTGLHFSGFKADGELIAVSVFGALDARGAYRAVMSLHGTRFDHESAQFYGDCSVR